MRRPIAFPKSHLHGLEALIQEKWSIGEFERFQCVWLRVALDLTPEQIATGLGWHIVSVRRVQESFAKRGPEIFTAKAKGGRHHQNLSLEEEISFLAPFWDRARRGELSTANEIRAAYEMKVGRKVAKSTIYRMLTRHDWRKIAPRPRHPKQDPAAAAAFKKTRGNDPGSSGAGKQATEPKTSSPHVPGRGKGRSNQ